MAAIFRIGLLVCSLDCFLCHCGFLTTLWLQLWLFHPVLAFYFDLLTFCVLRFYLGCHSGRQLTLQPQLVRFSFFSFIFSLFLPFLPLVFFFLVFSSAHKHCSPVCTAILHCTALSFSFQFLPFLPSTPFFLACFSLSPTYCLP